MRHHDLVARLECRQRDQRDELVGAVADDDLPGRHAERARERVAQRGAAAIRVEMHVRRLAADGLHHPR
jgi:hypothetical protein